MVSLTICNLIFIAFAISFSLNMVNFVEWYDKRQIEKRIAANKRRGNHFKEM